MVTKELYEICQKNFREQWREIAKKFKMLQACGRVTPYQISIWKIPQYLNGERIEYDNWACFLSCEHKDILEVEEWSIKNDLPCSCILCPIKDKENHFDACSKYHEKFLDIVHNSSSFYEKQVNQLVKYAQRISQLDWYTYEEWLDLKHSFLHKNPKIALKVLDFVETGMYYVREQVPEWKYKYAFQQFQNNWKEIARYGIEDSQKYYKDLNITEGCWACEICEPVKNYCHMTKHNSLVCMECPIITSDFHIREEILVPFTISRSRGCHNYHNKWKANVYCKNRRKMIKYAYLISQLSWYTYEQWLELMRCKLEYIDKNREKEKITYKEITNRVWYLIKK